MPKMVCVVSVLLIACTVAACNTDGSSKVTPTAEVIATPIVDVEPPPQTADESPLQGVTVEVPQVWIVPALQSKQALASYFKTTVEQLDWVNPGLADPVVSGTLVAIPPGYRVFTGEDLSAVAVATGLPEAVLRAANPKLSGQGDLPAGTVLSVPPLVIVQEATTLAATAASLNLSDSALLSANPDLLGDGSLEAGTVLVLPPGANEP